jgi:hypothetical protein
MIPRSARQVAAPLIVIIALSVLSSCVPQGRVRPAAIAHGPSEIVQSVPAPAWPEDLWIIAKREPSALEGKPEAPSFPFLQKRASEGQAPVPLPLQHTDVHAAVAGDIAEVRVQQQYLNPFTEKIDVEYVFPLPDNAAVSELVMTIGARRIRGIIRERQEAERLYAAAKQAGHVAALLTQERPNVFTQAVANIDPGKEIDIDITYFHTLAYEDSEYELVIPLTGGSHASAQTHSSNDVALSVDIDAGVSIEAMHSPSHAVDIQRPTKHSAHVELSRSARLPDKDFVLCFRTTSDKPKIGWVGHRDERGGFFALMLQPPQDHEAPATEGGQLSALTEVEVDWGTLQVRDVHPERIPDVLFGRAVVLRGRFYGVEPTTITVSGRTGNGPKSYTIAVTPADLTASRPALTSVWAREHIAALDGDGRRDDPEWSAQRIKLITDTALEYGLLSAYTTFLVVDASSPASSLDPARVDQP